LRTALYIRLRNLHWRILAYPLEPVCVNVKNSLIVGGQMLSDQEWEQLYQQALLELDEVKLAELILRAEQAMRKRLLEIQSNGKGNFQFEERHKLEDALTSLQCLQRISAGQSK
jgi:hypothetical protein